MCLHGVLDKPPRRFSLYAVWFHFNKMRLSSALPFLFSIPIIYCAVYFIGFLPDPCKCALVSFSIPRIFTQPDDDTTQQMENLYLLFAVDTPKFISWFPQKNGNEYVGESYQMSFIFLYFGDKAVEFYLFFICMYSYATFTHLYKHMFVL